MATVHQLRKIKNINTRVDVCTHRSMLICFRFFCDSTEGKQQMVANMNGLVTEQQSVVGKFLLENETDKKWVHFPFVANMLQCHLKGLEARIS